MKPEIKQRIEQIKNGEVPEGYKKTKIGITPIDWHNTCFAELFVTKSEYTEDLEKYPLYSLTIEDGVTPKSERYERSHLVKKENAYKVVEPNDFAYNPMNVRFGAVARHKGKTSVCVSGYYDVFTTKEKTDLKFMDDFLVSNIMITYYNKVSTGSLVEKQRVHYSEFINFNIPIPSKIERQKIAEILSVQDKIIELQQKMIDGYKRLKKGMLQKMFPKNGENIPEIRFPEFTAPWEQRKLESLCEVFTDGDWIEAKDQSDSGIRLVQTGNVGTSEYLDKENNRKWISEDTFERLHCEEIYEGDILISRLPEPAGRACIMPALGTRMITAVDCTIVRISVEYDNKYLVQYLSTPMYFNVVNSFLGGGTRQRISRGNLSGIHIPIPPTLAEQKKIGEYFEGIDNLITLHQRKLDEYKTYKKSLMQLLLTGIVRCK